MAAKPDGSLSSAVRSGGIRDAKTLKSEFRRRSVAAHPDTAGGDSSAFLGLKADFDEAARLLKLMRPAAYIRQGQAAASRASQESGDRDRAGKSNAGNGRNRGPARSSENKPFDAELFAQLLRRAHAAALPGRQAAKLPQNQRLLSKINKEAAKVSMGLLLSVRLYFGLHDTLEDRDRSGDEIRRCVENGLRSFLDATANANPNAARVALSFLDEAERRMSRAPGSVLSYLRPLVEWVRERIGEIRSLTSSE